MAISNLTLLSSLPNTIGLENHHDQGAELTHLNNRRAFMDLLEKQLQQARRGEHIFSVLLGDCDNLKIVNDQYGHEASNLLSKSIADNFRHCLRGCDTAEALLQHADEAMYVRKRESKNQLAMAAC